MKNELFRLWPGLRLSYLRGPDHTELEKKDMGGKEVCCPQEGKLGGLFMSFLLQI